MSKNYFLPAIAIVLIIVQNCFASQEAEHPIFSAIERADIHLVRQILASDPAAPFARDPFRKTPLHAVACKPAQYIRLHIAHNVHREILRLLIEAGAHVNVWNNSHQTPLHLAALNGYLDGVKLLVANGADLDAKRAEYGPPISWAALHSCNERRKAVASFLLLHGAYVEEGAAVLIEKFIDRESWQEIQAEGARRMLQALESNDVSENTQFPPDINKLLLSFLSRAWGPSSSTRAPVAADTPK